MAQIFKDSKPHYQLLDGLRGVAALMVVWYHVGEGFATSPIDQRFNHGYLAVDFFFILSGFVIGYAYDDRWGRMSLKEFFRRRLIRLHPMVIMGAVIGALTFCVQGCVRWDGTSVGLSSLLLALFLGMFLLPACPGAGCEVRGNGEMFPLNGPAWSLFFEYIGNIFYALVLHRLPTRWLAAVVGISGGGLLAFGVFNLSGYGHLGVGWSLGEYNFLGGMLRMLFSYSMGMLMARNFKPLRIRGSFWIGTILLGVFLAVPHVDDMEHLWMNGLYDSFCILVVFPCIVYMSASEQKNDRHTVRISQFLGDISYPLYMVHYPFMYLFYAWVWDNHVPYVQALPVAFGVIIVSIAVAYLCMRFYDLPLRRWLAAYLQKPGG